MERHPSRRRQRFAPVYLAVEKGLQQARANPRAPVCLWVKTVKGYGVRATVESATGGHGFPLSNGEKIIDFVNEIYWGAEDAGPIGQLGQDVARRLGRKGGRQKSQSRRRAGAAPAAKTDKVQGGLAKGAVRAAQDGLPSIPFPPTSKARRDQLFPEELSGSVPGSGRRGGQHDQHRRRVFQGGFHSYS